MNRKKWVFLSLGIGLVLGLVFAFAFVQWWAKSYLESAELIKDVSQKLMPYGIHSLSVGSTRVQFYPPAIDLSEIEMFDSASKKEPSTKLASIRKVEVKLALSSILAFSPELSVRIYNFQILKFPTSSTASEKTPNTAFGIPLFRKLNLDLAVESLKLPYSYLPASDFDLKMSLEEKDQKPFFKIHEIGMLGVRGQGSATLEKFDFQFLEKNSLVSGKLSGNVSPIKLQGEMKLPNLPLNIPPQTKWLMAEKILELSGKAALGGGVIFAVENDTWSSKAQWNLDLTEAGVSYGAYKKDVGKTSIVKGSFEGDSKTWKVQDMSIKLGNAQALVQVESTGQAAYHVAGKIEPFEISEFIPVFLKKASGKLSGRAMATLDLNFDKEHPGEPSGEFSFKLDDWILDGNTLVSLSQPESESSEQEPPVNASGTIGLKGEASALLEKGVFRNGVLKMSADLTALSIKAGEYFKKQAQTPFNVDLEAAGAGKSILIKSLGVKSSAGMQFLAKGSISDLKDYKTKIQILEGKFPLAVLVDLIPSVGGATGRMDLTGEMSGSPQGISSALLNWDFKNVSFSHDVIALKNLNGKLETTLRSPDDVPGTALEEKLILFRTPGLSAQWGLEPILGDQALPVKVQITGRAATERKAVSGDLSASFSELNLTPWIKKYSNSADSKAPVSETPEKVSPIDLKRSKLRLSVSAPVIKTANLDFHEANAVFVIGRKDSEFDVQVEKLAGKTLEGDLSMAMKVRLSPVLSPEKIELKGSGQNISMEEMSRVVSKISGKNLEASFFGKGDLSLRGVIGSQGLESADITGNAEIKNGGFKFLPASKKFIDHLKQIPRAMDRLPIEKDTNQVSDRLDKAQAAFHLVGSKMELKIEAEDSQISMNSKGHVTLGGHCELEGMIYPKGRLKSSNIGPFLEKGVPFSSIGDQWACSFKPQFGNLAESIVKAKVQEQIQEHKQEIIEKAKGAVGDLKNIFR